MRKFEGFSSNVWFAKCIWYTTEISSNSMNTSQFPGIREAFNPYAVLHLIPVGVGEVKIQGLESGLFLAMNPKGNLYAETDDSNEATIFLESSNGYYLNYLSKKYAHMGWHVGVTKQGRAKNGSKTWYPWGQKAIQFVSRKAYDEPHPLRWVNYDDWVSIKAQIVTEL